MRRQNMRTLRCCIVEFHDGGPRRGASRFIRPGPEVNCMRRDIAFVRNALLLLACVAVLLAVAVIVARALG